MLCVRGFGVHEPSVIAPHHDPECETTPVARRKWLRPALTTAFYVLLVAGLAYYLTTIRWSRLAALQIDLWHLLGFLAIALVLALGFRYWQTFIWITVLRNLGARDVRMTPELIDVYSKSWLGRYIPGTAPWILGKIYFASQHGLTKSKLAVGSLLEAAIQIVVLFVTSSIFLLLDPSLDVLGSQLRLLMCLVIVAGVIVLLPPVFNRIMNLALRILRRPPLAHEDRANLRTILVAGSQYVLGAVLSGASLYFVAAAIDANLDWTNFLFVLAASNLAGAVSMIAVFAPGGIGVRDGIQILLFNTIMPQAISFGVSVVTRIWAFAIDLLFFALGRTILIAAKRRRNRLTTAIGTGEREPSGEHVPASGRSTD
jgi:hypothetical protein